MLAIRALRMMRGFCQMKYYKEIASFLKVKVVDGLCRCPF
jgi:hypothetical protein